MSHSYYVPHNRYLRFRTLRSLLNPLRVSRDSSGWRNCLRTLPYWVDIKEKGNWSSTSVGHAMPQGWRSTWLSALPARINFIRFVLRLTILWRLSVNSAWKRTKTTIQKSIIWLAQTKRKSGGCGTRNWGTRTTNFGIIKWIQWSLNEHYGLKVAITRVSWLSSIVDILSTSVKTPCCIQLTTSSF